MNRDDDPEERIRMYEEYTLEYFEEESGIHVHAPTP